MTVNASLVSRVKKLLALSQNNPDIFEAKAAWAKAQELIARHSIQAAFLKVETGQTDVLEKILIKRIFATGRVATWLFQLTDTLGEVNSCECYFVSGDGIYAAGEEEDIALVEVLFNYLEGEVIRACKAASRKRNDLLSGQARDTMTRGEGRIFANRFKMGASDALRKRLRETQQKVEREVKELPNGTYALAVVTNKLVRAKDAVGPLRKYTYRHRRCPDGYAEGQRAGNQIKLKPEQARLRG